MNLDYYLEMLLTDRKEIVFEKTVHITCAVSAFQVQTVKHYISLLSFWKYEVAIQNPTTVLLTVITIWIFHCRECLQLMDLLQPEVTFWNTLTSLLLFMYRNTNITCIRLHPFVDFLPNVYGRNTAHNMSLGMQECCSI